MKVELQAIKYEICGDRTMRVIRKEGIKKLLGRSPNRADALNYAHWVLKQSYQSSNYLWLLPCAGN